MDSILKAFANENLIVAGQHIKPGSQYERDLRALCHQQDSLTALLNDEGKKSLLELERLHASLSCITAEEQFIYGYRLGMLMTIEVFSGLDHLIGDQTTQ